MKSSALIVFCGAALALGGVGCSANSVVSEGSKGVAAGGSNGSAGNTGNTGTGSNGGNANNASNGGPGNTSGAASNTSGGTGGTTGTPCVGLQCQIQACPSGSPTTLTGTVTDPAGANPLYNVVVYVPNSTPDPLPSGASCDSCDSLFSGDPVAAGFTTDVGVFNITNAPSGDNIPIVVQVGKWRTHGNISHVDPCTTTNVGSIALPSQMDPNDPIVNIPDIAVSTGGADSLECLLVRIGINSSEFVAGASASGKVHIFAGGINNGNQNVGGLETNQMANSPSSDTNLWDSVDHLMANDIVLLSCEGGETYDAQPANLEQYLESGGRVFASHYHYAWFAGPLDSHNRTTQAYSPPADWGSKGSVLADWYSGQGILTGDPTQGLLVTQLSNGTPFYKGQAMDDFLMNVGALGTSGAPPNELNIVAPRENAMVTVKDTYSQAWITDPYSTPGGGTLFFSFDEPLGGIEPSDGGAPQYCGRAVFSGLHVGAASYDSVNCDPNGGTSSSQGCNKGHITPAPPPAGCDTSHPLSPQEKALEFMLFDLSSCVVADTVNPVDAGSGPTLR